MKRLSMLLMLILTVGIGSAFATNETDKGGKNPVPDFNLKSGLYLVQTPTCGSDPEGPGDPQKGWSSAGITYTNTAVYKTYARTCVDTIYVPNPFTPGIGTFVTFTRTETKTIELISAF